jgi:hypothetical protein
VIMVGLAFGLAAARFFRPQELLIPAFVLAITLNLAAYMVSAYGQRTDTVREIAAVMPLGAVLAGRVLAGPVLRTQIRPGRVRAGRVRPGWPGAGRPGQARTPRLLPVLAIIGAGYALALAYAATEAPASPADQPLAAWLAGHGLHDGLAGYWQANSTTLDSGGGTLVAFAGINDGRLVQGTWEASGPDYDPRRHDATFVVTGGPQGVRGLQAAAERTFGPPARVYHAGGYTILAWDTNLLRHLGRMSG